MTRKRKAEAGAIRNGLTNPFDYLTGNQRLSAIDYAEKTGELQSNLTAHLRRHKKVIRLYLCFGCGENRTAQKMSNCLAVCRDCYRTAQDKGAVGKRNFVEKTLNNLHKFLRRRV